jgi:hypothetical protein
MQDDDQIPHPACFMKKKLKKFPRQAIKTWESQLFAEFNPSLKVDWNQNQPNIL